MEYLKKKKQRKPLPIRKSSSHAPVMAPRKFSRVCARGGRPRRAEGRHLYPTAMRSASAWARDRENFLSTGKNEKEVSYYYFIFSFIVCFFFFSAYRHLPLAPPDDPELRRGTDVRIFTWTRVRLFPIPYPYATRRRKCSVRAELCFFFFLGVAGVRGGFERGVWGGQTLFSGLIYNLWIKIVDIQHKKYLSQNFFTPILPLLAAEFGGW